MTYNFINNDKIWKTIFNLSDNGFDFVIVGGVADNINFSKRHYTNMLETSDLDIWVNDINIVDGIMRLFNKKSILGQIKKVPIWKINADGCILDIILGDYKIENEPIKTFNVNNINIININGYNLKYKNEIQRIKDLNEILRLNYIDINKNDRLRNYKILKYLKKLTIYNFLMKQHE